MIREMVFMVVTVMQVQREKSDSSFQTVSRNMNNMTHCNVRFLMHRVTDQLLTPNIYKVLLSQ